MTTRGKSINLFLMDSTSTGRIKVTLANWTGVSYKIPRTEIENCKGIAILKQSGVYFLFGTSDDTGENIVYIGQAGVRRNGDGILLRLQEHKRNPEKDYWTEAVVFTTSNNSFGPTEISYLENRFVGIANESRRYIVKNGNDPSAGNITEEKESELEEFIDYAKIVMGTLGHKVFAKLTDSRPLVDGLGISQVGDLPLYLKRKSKKSGQVIEAQCKRTSEGFVVLTGSHIETIDSESIPPGIKERRQKSRIENEILQEDVLFGSPSYAAAFVIGGHTNGLLDWKTVDGKTLKEKESEHSEV